MNNINNLFFELIQVSLGMRIRLSHTPSRDEWGELYSMAKKQTLVGICFAGVQKLVEQHQAPKEMLYLTWMGMSAKIQQRNHTVNGQCVALQKRLAADGLRSSILKGHGVGQLYAEHLRGLRQSGDIDVWVDASKDKVVALAQKMGVTKSAGYLHVGCQVFDDLSTSLGGPTELELHYRPTYMRSLRHNRRLQKFCEAHKGDWSERNKMVVPSWEFDVVYQLSHLYRHLFGLGIGLRQLLDYNFLLVNANDRNLTVNFPLLLSHLGLLNFAGAVMYVMTEVFHLEEQYLIVPVDKTRGRMLLGMVMQTGNFGHQDEKQRETRSSTAGSLIYKAKQWWQLVMLYPEETLSAPLWSILRRFD